jgi:hypothetical protein
VHCATILGNKFLDAMVLPTVFDIFPSACVCSSKFMKLIYF